MEHRSMGNTMGSSDTNSSFEKSSKSPVDNRAEWDENVDTLLTNESEEE
jgi:hypothetical protein